MTFEHNPSSEHDDEHQEDRTNGYDAELTFEEMMDALFVDLGGEG